MRLRAGGFMALWIRPIDQKHCQRWQVNYQAKLQAPEPCEKREKKVAKKPKQPEKQHEAHVLFFFFFLSFFMYNVYMQPFGLWQTLSVFTYIIQPGFCPLFFPFLLYLAAVNYCDFWVNPSWVYPSKSSPARSFFRSHSNPFSLAPSLPPTSVACKNLSNSAIAFLFASKPASHLLSALACHKTPYFSSSLTSFLRSFLHLRHLVYKCSTDWTVSLHH